jgi:hypothetical protein
MSKEKDAAAARSSNTITNKQLQEFLDKVPQLRNAAWFDCEWYRENRQENVMLGPAQDIYCLCLIDIHGNKVQLHLNQPPYNGDKTAFMTAVLDIIERYDCLIGYNILAEKHDYNKNRGIDSDIKKIEKNC